MTWIRCMVGALALVVTVVACGSEVSQKRSDDDDDGGGGTSNSSVGQGGAGVTGGAGPVGSGGGAVGSGGAGAAMPSYPPGPYGIQMGDTVANMTMTGIVNATVSNTLTTLSMADFYNPSQQGQYPPNSPLGPGPQPLALVISFCSVWVAPCTYMTSEVWPAEVATYQPQGAEFLMILIDGLEPATPATEANLLNWTSSYAPPYPTAINLQPPPALAAYPTVIIVETADMSVVNFTEGVPGAAFWADLQSAL